MYQNQCCLVLALWNLFHHLQVGVSFQVRPSEYAYLGNSVVRSEYDSANCNNYLSRAYAAAENYIHCNGTKLRLTDSNHGSELYSSHEYYVWNSETKSSRLLFIFTTRIKFSSITLHYYSDSERGLPGLRFWAVPHDFDIWDAPIASYSYVDVAQVNPVGEPTAHKNINIYFNLSTTKIVMYRSITDFGFALSEVEFFMCIEMSTTQANTPSNQPSISGTSPTAIEMPPNPTTGMHSQVLTTVQLKITYTPNSYHTKHPTQPQDSESSTVSKDTFIIPLAAGVTATVLVIVLATFIVIVFLLLRQKKRTQKKKNTSNLEKQDGLYSTLDRGTNQLQMQPQSHDAAGLYDKIQLSPSTGQSETISKLERENVYPSLQSDYHIIEKHESEKSNSWYETYAVVDKRKKKLTKTESRESQHNICCQDKNQESLKSADSQTSCEVEKREDQQSQRKENVEEMYAVVQKKPKKHEEEETAPPVPSYTVEALYTAVQKKPK